MELAAKPGEKILRVNRLGENLEFVTLSARFLQKVCGGCLS